MGSAPCRSRRPASAGTPLDLSAVQLCDLDRVAGGRSMIYLTATNQLLQIAIAIFGAPVLLGWVNQCRAWLQNRRAPSLWQPYHGLYKLFHKDALIATNASPLFRGAPYFVFGAMVLAAAIIPPLGTRLPFTIAADGIALVGLLALARVAISLARSE